MEADVRAFSLFLETLLVLQSTDDPMGADHLGGTAEFALGHPPVLQLSGRLHLQLQGLLFSWLVIRRRAVTLGSLSRIGAIGAATRARGGQRLGQHLLHLVGLGCDGNSLTSRRCG